MEYLKPRNTLVIRGCFDSMFSSKLCGSKLTDFFGSLSSQASPCLLLKIEEPDEAIELYDQLFRRILTEISDQAGEKAQLKVVVDLPEEQSLAALREMITNIWREVVSLFVSVLFSIFHHPLLISMVS